MRLSRIEIENFKGVSRRQAVDLKPLTLLFGPNSAGKSTILQALHYVREILERQNIDPDLTIAGGLIDLGGFAALVHNHELARSMRIKLVLDLLEEQGSDELPLNSGARLNDEQYSEVRIRYLYGENEQHKQYAIVQEVSVEVEVQWSELTQKPYPSRLTVGLDGIHFASIVSPADAGRAQLTDFNFEHPQVQSVLDDEEYLEANAQGVRVHSPLEDAISALAGEAIIDRANDESPPGPLRISVVTANGALPFLDGDLILGLRDPDVKKWELEEKTPRVVGLRHLLSEMILGPLRLVRNYLTHTTYIGPLREVPSRSYRPQVSPDEARWATGLAAWDLLYVSHTTSLMAETNEWLANEKLLNTGYQIERIEFREIPVPSRFQLLFERGITEDDIAELQEAYSTLRSRGELALRDFKRGILVAPSDVGVGVSQLVPVVVAALRGQDGLLAIEQPELHVHPAIQVRIGDLFIKATHGTPEDHPSCPAMLIETHSEHIMLRLLRRIRETTEATLPPDAPSLSADEVSVIYVEGDQSGVTFKPLRIDSSGEFIDHWPRGFFEERAEELF